jgi:hypothetical protein
MAHVYTEQARTYEASGDLSASQFCFMKLDSNGQIAVATEGSGSIVGVLTDKPAARGRAGRVVWAGTTMVKAGGTLVPGDRVSCDSTGKAVALGTGDSASLGVVVTGGVSGDVLSVQLDFRGQL